MPAALPVPSSDPPGASLFRLASLLVASLLLLPLLSTDVPPLLDYPNHLARFWILAHAASDPVLSRIYAAHWAVLPNLGTDVLATLLLQWLPLHVAGRMVLAAVLLLPVTGAVAYHRALCGTRSLWPLGSAAVASGGSFLLGFLNFSASLGLALCVAALWERWRERAGPGRLAVLGAAGTLVILCHAGGFLLLCCLAATAEAESLWRGRHLPDMWPCMLTAAIRGTVLAAPMLLLLAAPQGGAVGGVVWRHGAEKLPAMLAPVRGYDPGLDIALAGILAGSVAASLLGGWGRLHGRTGAALAILAMAAVLSPGRLGGAGFFDMRFACMAWLLLCAGFLPDAAPALPARVATVLAGGLIAVRSALLASVWQAGQADIAGLRQAMAPVQPGDRVLVAQVTEDEAPGYWALPHPGRIVPGLQRTDLHLSGLLVPERRAFWPLLFNYPAQQPVQVLPPYDGLSMSESGLIDRRLLDGPRDALPQPLRSWRQDFDWLLVVDAGGAPSMLVHPPGGLAAPEVWTDAAALFRIIAPGPAAAAAPAASLLP